MRELNLWQIRAIIRGYRRSQEEDWAMTRWHAFWALHNGMTDLTKAGIHSPQDLLPLPHDTREDGEDSELPTDEEVKRMQEEMRRWNEEHATAK